MKVGDYVRTKKGIIGKIKLIDNQTELEDLYLVKRQWYFKEDFIKSSPNIIDLIEVGDYIDGVIVTQSYIDNIKYTALEIKENNYGIKSIVTKEQFESMEYKIREK